MHLMWKYLNSLAIPYNLPIMIDYCYWSRSQVHVKVFDFTRNDWLVLLKWLAITYNLPIMIDYCYWSRSQVHVKVFDFTRNDWLVLLKSIAIIWSDSQLPIIYQ
jgi:hypothetical protein